MTLSEYLDFGQKGSTSTGEQQRRDIYGVFLESKHALYSSTSTMAWDEADRVLSLGRRCLRSKRIREGATSSMWGARSAPYDFIYIDEAQDLRPAELALALLSTGNRWKNLSLGGGKFHVNHCDYCQLVIHRLPPSPRQTLRSRSRRVSPFASQMSVVLSTSCTSSGPASTASRVT